MVVVEWAGGEGEAFVLKKQESTILVCFKCGEQNTISN